MGDLIIHPCPRDSLGIQAIQALKVIINSLAPGDSREAKWRHACQQTAGAVHTGNVWERSWHAESPNMADALVWLREGDVKGAKLPQTSVEKNTIDDLRRWLECRGLTSQKKESHAALVRRYGTVLLSMFSEKFRLIETDKCTCTE